MKIGLLFGTFDPIHIGHINMAASALNSEIVNHILFVPTMQNVFKDDKPANFYYRCHMIYLALQGIKNCEICSIDYKSSTPYYSYKTLTLIKEIYPEDELYLIIGADVYDTIDLWENSQWIKDNFKIIVVTRPGHPVNSDISYKHMIFENFDVSSTTIRHLIKSGKETIPLIPKSVKHFIEKYELYK